MPRYKKKRSFRKSYRRKARGKRTTLKRTIKQVLNRNTETKYYDVADENVQIYHNMGRSGGAILGPPAGDTTFFNPWADIPPGTGRANRIGDRIKPLSMSINLWLATKLDRPNVMFLVMVLRMPKSIVGTVTTRDNVDPFQASQLGNNGNRMTRPIDTDRGVKAYYDRVFNVQLGNSFYSDGAGRECHKLVRISLRRKQSREVVYDSGAQNIVNSPLTLLIIPYDSFGSLVTDNIASYAYSMRMRYKDS
jgi:hypothetical protein